ncbi:MAG: exosortase-associated EpsI family protein [Phycisphaeraceae bacterium]|nr:exosortase-associated EpsI family protein [Phycisphaeraceae bacterium]MCW5761972.1 exosortase-associated EpsI family protein [Phycisphaeraceae bacterium]
MSWRALLNPAFMVSFAMLSLAAIGMSAAIQAYGIHLQKKEIYPYGNRQVGSIPRETPSWRQVGTDEMLDEDTVKTLGTKNYVSRVYVQKDLPEGKSPQMIELHVAYYTGGIDTVPHVPERCMVAGGWIQGKGAEIHRLVMDTSSWIEDDSLPAGFEGGPLFTVRTLPPPFSDAPGTRFRLPRGVSPTSQPRIRVTEFMSPDSRTSLYAGYFFIANGGTAASAEGVRTLAFDLRNDYAYYLKVQVSGRGFDSASAMVEVSSSLLGELMAELMRCVPDWAQVEMGLYPEDNPRRDRSAG